MIGMIGNDEIDVATARLNPAVGAANSIASAFGNAESVPMTRDIAAQAGIDYDALIQFGRDVFEAACEEPTREDPREHAEGAVYGLLVGVLAAREAADSVGSG